MLKHLRGFAALFALAFGAAGQTPNITNVINSGSGAAGTIAPGEQVTLQGSNLGDATAVACSAAGVTTIPTTCGSVSVTVNGTAVPVLSESASQVVILTPVPLTGTSATIQLTRQVNGQPAQSNTVTTSVAATAPGLLTVNQNGAVVGLFIDSSGNQISASNPAKPGQVIAVRGTGFGITNPLYTPGTAVPSSPPYNVVATVTLTVGGQSVTPSSAALGPAGSYGSIVQVSFTVPQGVNGQVGVSANVGGVNTQTVQLQTSGSSSGGGGGNAGSTPTISSVSDFGGTKQFCPGGTMIINGADLGNNPTVTVGGKNAYLIVPPSQNNGASMIIEIPVDAGVGSSSVVVTTNGGGASAPFAVTLVQYAPMLVAAPNSPLVWAFHANQAQITPSYPATPGEMIYVLAVGLGPTNPALATGASAPNGAQYPTATMPSVSVGGSAATGVTAFAQSGNPGYYLVGFNVPGSLSNGNSPVKLTIGGASSNSLNVPVSTAPVVVSVVNAASNIPQALPNSGIAQGAVFSVTGELLGPSTLTISPAPFQNGELSGTSMSVTVAGTKVTPLLYYTSSTQVSALLPSNTPTGTGTITVTYNGQTSQPAPITVVQNNIGIFTVTSDGMGSAIVTYPDYSLVSTTKAANCGGPYTTCGAANPGDTLVIWGTGLGPINGNDSAGDGLGVNQPNIPLTVWLGGVAVKASYQGRGCCVGEDQIIFTVPNNVPTGCAVPLSIQINSEVSNGVAIPVASGSRSCTPVNPAFASPSALSALSTGTATYGSISLSRQDNFPNGGSGFTDSVSATFAKFAIPAPGLPFFLTYTDVPPIGSCQVYPSGSNGYTPSITLLGALDVGSPLTVSNGGASKTFPISGGQGGGVLSGNGGALNPGTLTVSAPGGADVAAFTANVTIPQFPTMTNPKPDSQATAVSRASGLTVTWTGGTPDSYVEIDGSSATDNTGKTAASFQCLAPASAGSFTIPPSVLLAMPAGGFASLDFHPSILPVAFSAKGLAVTVLTAQWDSWAGLNLK